MDNSLLSVVWEDTYNDLVTSIPIEFDIIKYDSLRWYPQKDGTIKVVVLRNGIPQGHIV